MALLWTLVIFAAAAIVDGQVGMGMGTCTFDPKCYIASSGCSLAKETPFWRMTPMSCEECLDLCQQKLQGPTPPFCCQSAVWDAVTRSCDLFAVKGYKGKNMQNYPGRIYFQPTYMPGCASNNTSTNTSAPSAVCKDGETAKIIAVKDYAVDGISGKDVSGVDADGCGKACLTNKLPDGSSYACKAAQFKDGKCTLSDQAPKSEGDQKKSDGATFYRLYCFPTELVKNCPDTFLEMPQKILVGQNKQTLDKDTLDECIKSCLNSKTENGFVCKSAIFYYNEKKLNCILNIESSKTKPDLFTDAGPDDIEVYFEPGCGGGERFKDAQKKKTKAFKDALMDIPEEGDWTNWSPCHGRNSFQFRSRRCRETNPNKCKIRETRSCDPLARSSVTKSPGNKKTGDDKLLGGDQRKRDQVSGRHH